MAMDESDVLALVSNPSLEARIRQTLEDELSSLLAVDLGTEAGRDSALNTLRKMQALHNFQSDLEADAASIQRKYAKEKTR